MDHLCITDSSGGLGYPFKVDNTKGTKTYIHSGEKFILSSNGKRLAPILMSYLGNHHETRDLRMDYDNKFMTSYRHSNRFDVVKFYHLTMLDSLFLKLAHDFSNSLIKYIFYDLMNYMSSNGFDRNQMAFISTMFRASVFKRNKKKNVGEICNFERWQKFSDLGLLDKDIESDVDLSGYDYDPSDFEDVDYNSTLPLKWLGNEKTSKGNTMDSTKLYKHIDADGKEHFCTYLATDSTGRYVVEVKGTGGVISVAKDSLDEVVPFTVLITWFHGTTQHFMVDKTDLLKVGMLIFVDGHMGRVQKLNTKEKTTSAIDLTKVQILVTTPLIAEACEPAPVVPTPIPVNGNEPPQI